MGHGPEEIISEALSDHVHEVLEDLRVAARAQPDEATVASHLARMLAAAPAPAARPAFAPADA